MSKELDAGLFHVCKHCDYVLAPHPEVPFDVRKGVCPGCGQPVRLTREQKEFWLDVQNYMDKAKVTVDTASDEWTQLDATFAVPRSVLRKMPRYKVFFLRFNKGPFQGKRVRLNSRQYVIGRTMGDLQIPDPKISRKHSQIEVLSRDLYYIKDLASRNGTFINENRISYAKLKSGDVIRMGSSVFHFEVEQKVEL